jgi:hypothetical protein
MIFFLNFEPVMNSIGCIHQQNLTAVILSSELLTVLAELLLLVLEKCHMCGASNVNTAHIICTALC